MYQVQVWSEVRPGAFGWATVAYCAEYALAVTKRIELIKDGAFGVQIRR